MTRPALQRVEEVYFRVAGLPEVERRAALDSECAADPALRAEVESLLRHEAGAQGFLEQPAMVLPGSALDPAAASPADEVLGTPVGPWRIERRIASGGMGSVYLGVRADGQFQQQVAIKIVKRGMDSEEVLQRFMQERRTLGALQHPNIARLLDAGVAVDGRPALVMEYVPGEPINTYCDRRGLGVADRLRLFRAVCEAVKAAHRLLVVHRDLKPGNILVTEDGAPKLLDFGIAKLLGEPSQSHTLAADRRLTPEYASPEQIAGLPLTTATDVYSLGVILFELLSGERPYTFETRSTRELERVICHQQPAPPSEAVRTRAGAGGPDAASPAALRQATPRRLRRALAGDLDNIVLMAMRKEPERRYSSVEQLALDLDRYLSGMPVIARPDTLHYRTGKFVRRHRVGVSLGAALALLAAVAVGGIAWQERVATRQRDAAYLARDQWEHVVAFLRRMLSSADPANEGPEATIRAVLDSTAVAVQSELRDQPLVRAAVQSTIGQSYLALGLFEQAAEHLEGAYQTRLAELGPGHHDVAESRMDIARLRYEQGRFPEAEALLRQALETHRRLRGPENADTARVMNDLGAVLRASGQIEEAESLHRRALDIRTKEHGPQSLEVAESLNNLAGVLAAKGDAPGAAEVCERALAIRRAVYPPDHPLVFQSVANLGVMVGRGGDHARAESLLREALDLGLRRLREDHPDVARTMGSLAGQVMLQGRAAEAEPMFRRALEARLKVLPAGSEQIAVSRINLGRCLAAQGKDAEAATLLREALVSVRGSDGRVPAAHGPVVAELAGAYRRLEREAEATEVEQWAPPSGGAGEAP